MLPECEYNDPSRRPLLLVDNLGVEVVHLDFEGSLQRVDDPLNVLRESGEGGGGGLEEAGHGEDETGGLLAVLGGHCAKGLRLLVRKSKSIIIRRIRFLSPCSLTFRQLL